MDTLNQVLSGFETTRVVTRAKSANASNQIAIDEQVITKIATCLASLVETTKSLATKSELEQSKAAILDEIKAVKVQTGQLERAVQNTQDVVDDLHTKFDALKSDHDELILTRRTVLTQPAHDLEKLWSCL